MIAFDSVADLSVNIANVHKHLRRVTALRASSYCYNNNDLGILNIK